ncbi:MAG: hypothetical protein ACKV1O_25185 [Saprospiraceae bacterium]
MAIGKKIKRFIRKLRPTVIRTLVYSNTSSQLNSILSNKTILNTRNRKSGFSEIDLKITRNRIAFYIIENNEVAHVSWLFKKKLLAWQLGLKDQYVIGNCITDEKYRGSGLYGLTVLNIIQSYPNQTFVLFIEPSNASSIKGVQKIGLTLIGDYVVYRLFGVAYKIKKHDTN